jgi:ring-1,2-phenylacetyl-CoA epoxidase subunit PaaC
LNHFTSLLLHLADSTLLLAQKNAEWCGHGPVLEQDIAITNISLDLLGQSRNFYQYAATLIGNNATEDTLAYLRTEREYKNLLITELPNGDWAQSVLRQFLFSAYQQLLFTDLQHSNDEQLAAIAAKSLKEVSYHVRWSGEWVIRLGDGTDESHQRLFNALEELWPYTGEMFMPADYETASNIQPEKYKDAWTVKVRDVFREARLTIPEKKFMQSGGKQGKHTEHLGYILAELQHMQRTYPGSEW